MPTQLTPLEETMFRGWAKANGVQNHDDPKNFFDHRGLYKSSGGLVQPPHMINSIAANHNAMAEQANKPAPISGGGDQADPFAAQAEVHKTQQKAVADQRKDHLKMESEKMKLEHKSKEAQLQREHQMKMALMQEMLKRTAPPPPPKPVMVPMGSQHAMSPPQGLQPQAGPPRAQMAPQGGPTPNPAGLVNAAPQHPLLGG